RERATDPRRGDTPKAIGSSVLANTQGMAHTDLQEKYPKGGSYAARTIAVSCDYCRCDPGPDAWAGRNAQTWRHPKFRRRGRDRRARLPCLADLRAVASGDPAIFAADQVGRH